jgi:hypothetical protein
MKTRSRVANLATEAMAIGLALLILSFAASALTVRADEVIAPDSPGQAGTDQTDREWRFRVFLDDKEIGFHHFFLEEQGETRVLRSVADFEYKLLFVKLYEYEHHNHEVWHGDCLNRIESSTDANGEPFAVQGERQDKAFLVRGSEGETSLPSCVMSFAYWNPEFLNQARLLNSQDGEYVEVQVSAPEFEELEIRGERRPSLRYRLAAGPLNLDLWYSEDREWLGLQSEARGGRLLRYELL